MGKGCGNEQIGVHQLSERAAAGSAGELSGREIVFLKSHEEELKLFRGLGALQFFFFTSL